jgi:glutamate synthase (NADPH/NADH) small chain
MGKPTGFKEIERNLPPDRDPAARVADWGDFHGHAGDEQLRAQASRCMDCGTPFCHTGDGRADTRQTVGCPLNNLIPEWNDLVYRGLWRDALDRLHKTNNFPEFTGKVCPAPCESACVLAIIEPAVTIKNTEWSIIERGFSEGWVRPQPPAVRTGKRVAVVGSGPAGLACADQLNKAGHQVTVYERADRIGGLLMYGIPNMKLEKHLVDRRVQLMAEEGVAFRTGVEVGRNLSGAELRTQSDAVVLCCGATNPRDLPIPGRELDGVHQAMEYLTVNTKWLLDGEQGRPRIDAAGKDVLVIGGGDTGTDCVGTAMRQGCRSLTQIEIVPEFPASLPWPQFGRTSLPDYGQEEVAAVHGADPRGYSVTAERFTCDAPAGGGGNGVTHTRLVDVDWRQGGPQPVSGSARAVPTQLVLLSMGFLGPEDTLLDQFRLQRDERSNAKAEYGKFATNLAGVFAAGDVRRGASLVVWAIMEGRGAARECDRYLMGTTLLP